MTPCKDTSGRKSQDLYLQFSWLNEKVRCEMTNKKKQKPRHSSRAREEKPAASSKQKCTAQSEKCCRHSQGVAARSRRPAVQLACSNSSMSTSPSPFRSNILKAISKFLWGAALKTRNNKDQLKKIKAQKGAGVTSSERLYPKAIFHKYYKCPQCSTSTTNVLVLPSPKV